MKLNIEQFDPKEREIKEKEMLKQFRQDEKEAFINAYDLYADQIYRFIYFKIGNHEEAQDLTSIVFLKTWNYLQINKLEDPKTLRALIYKISRTSIIDHYRKSANRETTSIDDKDREINLPDQRINLLKKAEIDSDVEAIKNKLNQLKDEYKDVIVMRYVDELSIKEIAEILEKRKGSVRVLLHRALKSLQDLLNGS